MSKPVVKRRRVALALLVLLLSILVLGLLFSPAEHLPAAHWGAQLESTGFKGILVFLTAGAVATSVGLPRQLVAFIGGLAYGVGIGLLLSLIAALAGCVITATVSRRYFAELVTARYPNAIATLDRLIKRDLFLKILVLRLQPLGTNLLTNVCIGFTSASLPLFLMASAVGYIPQMLVFNLLGAGVRVDSQSQMVLSIVLLCLSIGIGAVVYRRHARRAP